MLALCYFLSGCVAASESDSGRSDRVDRYAATDTASDADGDGYTEEAGDCNDTNPGVYPTAEDICNGIDDDCDGVMDEAGKPWFYDADGDGSGVGDSITECERPAGYAPSDGDCDDTNRRYHPGALEEDCTDPNDYNCDGAVVYADDDGDGYAACEDCADYSAAVNPGAQEHCDGVDENCNGVADENPVDGTEWYADTDSDGYGNVATSLVACEQPEGYVLNIGDCDDADEKVNPAGEEHCSDGVDSNCDGDGDDPTSVDAYLLFRDADGDDYGNASGGTLVTCFLGMALAWSESWLDCDDTDSMSYPGASETCDGRDNDCNGTVDDGVCL